MPDIKILTEAELRDLVPLDTDAVACVEQGFTTLAGGKVVMPPIMTLMVPDHNGEVWRQNRLCSRYRQFCH